MPQAVTTSDYPTVTLAHGGGGRMSQILIERMFVPAFANQALEQLHDGAVLAVGPARLAFSTDSFVIRPLFFPGGDIGSLAVHGTVNDLAMCGARPSWLSAGLILEEGLPMEQLWQVIQSMREAALAAGISIVTGDTKVVDRGKGDGIFINTAGIGLIPDGITIAPSRAQPGDIVLINGPIAAHDIAIMAQREGLEFETTIVSDSAPLHDLVARLLSVCGARVHVLRDPAGGGYDQRGAAAKDLLGHSGAGRAKSAYRAAGSVRCFASKGVRFSARCNQSSAGGITYMAIKRNHPSQRRSSRRRFETLRLDDAH